MFPVLLEIGPVTVYSFGVLMAAGFYIGSALAVREYSRRGGNPDHMWNVLVWVFIAGLVGSRVLSVFNDVGAFLRDPLGELLSGSGFVWYGGLIGGILAAVPLHRYYRIPFTTLLDCCALGLASGQAIGRLGCHVSGDGDWGKVTELPWGVAYENAIIGWNYAPGVMVHPTPLYEAAAYMAVFALIYGLRKRDLPPTTLFSIYLVGTSMARFLVEFIRLNPPVLSGLTQAQVIAIILFTAGTGLLVRNLTVFASMKEAAP